MARFEVSYVGVDVSDSGRFVLGDQIRRNPHSVTRDFEMALCAYTGAPFAVAVNSCTSALLLSVARHLGLKPVHQIGDERALLPHQTPHEFRIPVEIPRRTYVSVPCSIIHAGGRPAFRDEDWQGFYQLRPYPVWDSARWFTSQLYPTITREAGGGMVCVSFHASKTLGLEQGGAILHGDPDADAWLRRMRFDGRTEGVAPKDDAFREVGYHCYLNPSTAALGILKLHSLPLHNSPLPNDPYPDLSTFEIFR